MADTTTLSNEAASAAVDGVTALLDGGFLDIFDGAQPATPDTAITTQVRLATLTFGTPAFNAAVDGAALSTALGADASADATGTAAWFRAYKADHTSPVFDGSVGTAGCNLNLTTVAIVLGGGVSGGPLTYTQAKVPC